MTYALAAHGANITCHGGHDQARLDRVVRYIREHGGRARGLRVALDAAHDIVPHLDDIGMVDILVVAFGPILYAPLSRTTRADWQRMIDLNLTLPAILVSRYLPHMVERGWGRIILFGGPRADRVHGYRDIAAYASAKAGLATLCKSAAAQTAGQNVTVNLISPGYVDTEYLDERTRRDMRARAPRGTLIAPERVARVATRLIIAEESDINGAIITVDQGLV